MSNKKVHKYQQYDDSVSDGDDDGNIKLEEMSSSEEFIQDIDVSHSHNIIFGNNKQYYHDTLFVRNYYSNSEWNKNTLDHGLCNLLYSECWFPYFRKMFDEGSFAQIEMFLSNEIYNNVRITPPPHLLFYSFNMLPPNLIKVVIIGQDPYIQLKQAMGASFSVGPGRKIPPSLKNIYKNMVKFGHLSSEPSTGFLLSWLVGGCFLLNTSLTTEYGVSNKHARYWNFFADSIINMLNSLNNKIVFLAWGAPAHAICKKINTKRHKVIMSSHPSPLSCAKKCGEHPPFMDVDHFGLANAFLKENDRSPINWNLVHFTDYISSYFSMATKLLN